MSKACFQCGSPLQQRIRCGDCGRIHCSDRCHEEHYCPAVDQRKAVHFAVACVGFFLLLLMTTLCGGALNWMVSRTFSSPPSSPVFEASAPQSAPATRDAHLRPWIVEDGFVEAHSGQP